jgi:DNA-binding PucR family transcriptional regulator
MEQFANALIDAMGGTVAVAELTNAPPSSVSRWRKDLSGSRLNHLVRTARMERPELDLGELADRHGVALPEAVASEGGEADHVREHARAEGDGSPGNADDLSATPAEIAA